MVAGPEFHSSGRMGRPQKAAVKTRKKQERRIVRLGRMIWKQKLQNKSIFGSAPPIEVTQKLLQN